jgi:hypothetical protein
LDTFAWGVHEETPIDRRDDDRERGLAGVVIVVVVAVAISFSCLLLWLWLLIGSHERCP